MERIVPMKIRPIVSFAIATTVLLAAGHASAQSEPASEEDTYPTFSLGLSPLGWTPSPATYLFAFDGYFHFDDNWSLGPQLQVGAKSGDTLITFTMSGRYHTDLFKNTRLEKVRPYLQGGLGLGHLGTTEFLFNTGVGIDVDVTDHVVVGSNMLFNVLPGSAISGEDFIFSWQVVHVSYRF
jgi:hypothetical protein